MIVGAAMSKATGGNPQLGAFIAMNAIKNNLFWEQIAEFRNSLKEQDLSNLEPWECQVVGFNVGVIAAYSEMAIVFNNSNVDVFSSESVGLSGSFYPMDGIVGVGHLEDWNGNVVKDPDIINGQVKGFSLGASGAVLGGVAKFWSPTGYRFVIKFVQTNISGSFSCGITRRLGKLEDL